MKVLQRAFTVVFAGLQMMAMAQGTPDAAVSHPEFVRFLTGEIDRFRRPYGEPGISIVTVDAEGPSWIFSTGIADRETGRRMDEGTLFELGSISKLFTCAAVLQLRERGLVDLDRPIKAYLPEFEVVSKFPEGAEAITVRMLMTHHSGLMMDDDPWETTEPERYFYRAVLPHLKDKPLLFPPGERMHYSSFGINLLGLLIERRSGIAFSQYMNEHLLKPLDMPAASFDFRELPAGHLATPYGYLSAWDAIPMDEIRPAGSLRAPVSEVGHFVAMILAGGEFKGKRVLSRESVAEMIRIQNGGNCLDPGARVALGFMAEPCFLKQSSPDEIDVLYHYGAGRTKSLLVLVPAWKQGLVMSCNDWAVTDAAYDLFSKAWSWYLRTLFAEAGEPYQYHRAVPDLRAPGRESLASLEGDYASTHGLKTLRVLGNGLVEARGAMFEPLVDGRFVAQPWSFPRKIFQFDGTGVLATIDGYPVDRWERLGLGGPPESLQPWIGVWELDAGAAGPKQIILCERQGRLLVRPVRGPANEGIPGIFDDPGALFPLRFLDSQRAEVVNGALSGFTGCQFRLEMAMPSPCLILVDRLGRTIYRKVSQTGK
jgi:CubicO group peptidase (beta-lactamase class C family)